MSKPIFSKLLQVGFVVKNAEETARVWAEKYGIGPWDYWGPGMMTEVVEHGKPSDTDIRVACAFIGETEIELIEPIGETGIYAEQLKEHGEGLHHLAFDTTEDHDATVERFLAGGAPVLLDGYFGGEEEVTYMDARSDMKVICEFYKRPDDVKYPDPDKVITVPED